MVAKGYDTNTLSLPCYLCLPMKYPIHIIISLFCLYGLRGQSDIDLTLKRLNNNSVPYIGAERLLGNKEFLLLDAREKVEFEISHIANAIWVGDKIFDGDKISAIIPNKNRPIVVYCSIGIRSEVFGEKLLKKGYTEVYNLYGGIFQWKNMGFPVYDTIGQETDRVHAYNKQWGRMLNNATKVYKQKK
ncbi:rhodanese-related sulfurtransferase [Arenibacter sp. ARW7G5Y1]|nr:rhodanese-related sulfurtransferase [Arenibacter sp. ARW7G5Y1]